MKKPATGTREWAEHSVNLQLGCEHDCAYCYAKTMAVRFKRCTAEEWTTPQLVADLPRIGKRTGRIMFPTTHDITERNIGVCLTLLHKMLSVGNEVLVVSKPTFACVTQMCEELQQYRDRVTFRFTIGAASTSVLKLWEPGAPSFEERMASLECAHMAGFNTSVSCEPLLTSMPYGLVQMVDGFVTDTIWIGLANKLAQRMAMNNSSAELVAEAARLQEMQSLEWLRHIYARLNSNPKIRWKDSVKKLLGLELQDAPGEVRR